MRIAFLLLLLGLDASAAGGIRMPRGSSTLRQSITRGRGARSGTINFSPPPRPLYELLPTDGMQSPRMTPICSAVSEGTDLIGSWWCSDSLAGSKPGSVSTAQFTVKGTPTTRTTRFCPNGLDCDPITYLEFPNINGATASADKLLGKGTFTTTAGIDFTACALVVPYTQGSSARLITTETNYFFLDLGSTYRESFRVFKASGASTTVTVAAASALNRDAPHLVCGVYDYISDGGSSMIVYDNGVNVGSSAVAVGPVPALSGGIWSVMGSTAAGTQYTGRYLGAFYTETALSSGRMTSLTAQVIGTLRGAGGEAVTYTRNTAGVCAHPTQALITGIGKNMPCVADGTFQWEPATTESMWPSRDLSDANWIKSSMTCTTNVRSASDSLLASTCTATGASGTVLRTLAIAAATRTTTAHVKRRTGTGTIEITRNNGTTWSDITALINSSTYTRMTPLNVAALTGSVLNPVIGFRITTSGDAIDVDYVNDTAGSIIFSPTDTATATLARATVSATGAAVSYSNSSGCTRSKVRVPNFLWAGSPVIIQSTVAGTPILLGLRNANWGASMGDGTTTVTANLTSAVATTKYNTRSHWNSSSPDQISIEADGVAASTGLYDDTIGSANTFTLGSITPMWIGNLVIDNGYTNCAL